MRSLSTAPVREVGRLWAEQASWRPGGLWLPAILTICSLAVGVSASDPRFLTEIWGDEFLLPWYGLQVAEGRAPYRDFFVFLGPLAPYGSGLLVWAFGPGVVAFRVVQVLALSATTITLYGILRKGHVRAARAVTSAAWLPLLVFPLWPMFNHQWVALALGVAAVRLALSGSRPALGVLLAGLFAAAAGLVVQTMGLVAFPLAGACVMLRESRFRLRAAARFCIGALIPVVICSGLLISDHALGAFFTSAVLWPLQFYEQPGGFNEGSLRHLLQQRPVPTPLSSVLPGSDSLAIGLLLSLALLTGLLILYNLWMHRKAERMRHRTVALLAVYCFTLVVFEAGRSDVPHLAYLAVVFLALLPMLSFAPPARAVAYTFQLAALLFGLLRWTVVWLEKPPSPLALLAGDAYTEQVVKDALVAPLPGALDHNLPIILLSRIASVLYLYWSPVDPPVDWMAPPSWGSNSPGQYDRLATFIREERVPFIIVGHAEQEFLTDPSPIRDLLTTDYRALGDIEFGRVFVRR